MYTGDVWGITLIIFGVLLSLGALQLVGAAVFPGFVAQGRRNLGGTTKRRFGVAACSALFIFTIVVGLVLVNIPVLQPFGSLILLGDVLLMGLGLGTVSYAVGGRMGSADDAERPWRTVLRGAVTTELAFVLPVIGWFLLLPVFAIVGTGAALLALFQPSERREAALELIPSLRTAELAA